MWQSIDNCVDERPFGGNTDTKQLRATEILTHAINSSSSCVLVAQQASYICGTITGHLHQRPTVKLASIGVIYSLWVDTEQRRQGIGTLLLRGIEQQLQQMGAEAFQVGWDTGNPTAARWWQKYGYRPYEVIASKNISLNIEEESP
jgi:ribosomal protein S18 acetylase RimI-like enzyme